VVVIFGAGMPSNLIEPEWKDLDSAELRLLLHMRIGGPGQYDRRFENPNTLYLPLARSSCKIKLTFSGKQIIAAEPGPAFDVAEWERIRQEIQKSILSGSARVGREYSFSAFRVPGSWWGSRSGVQIMPPPEDAPRAPVEIADHPFILEFPLQASDLQEITTHRRTREHRRLTLLLNILLRGHTSFQPARQQSFWAIDPGSGMPDVKWVQQFFFANLGPTVVDALSTPMPGEMLEVVDPSEYYASTGHDGTGLQVPSDLDNSICLYLQLSPGNRAKFDRATFWMDIASRQWGTSISSSFTSLVSAVESLTDRGTTHRVYCQKCGCECQHEMPGATERFRAFFETYAPGKVHRSRRSKMYSLRSGIVHGSDLMQLDQDLAFGWDPPGLDEHELYNDLWTVTRAALRNWLRNPPMASNSSKQKVLREGHKKRIMIAAWMVFLGIGGTLLLHHLRQPTIATHAHAPRLRIG
jgi:hypothetical protein